MKKANTPITPTSLGENENIIVMINRKESRLSKINALSISDIIAQAVLYPAPKSKLIIVRTRLKNQQNILPFPTR